MPSLLERAIGEINELEPDIVVCSGDLTTFGFKQEYADGAASTSTGSSATRSSSSRATTTRATSATSTSRSCSATATRCSARAGVTVVAVDSTEPDLDHGQIGRGRYRWIEEQFAPSPPSCEIFVLHHHLLPVPGHGARAERRLRRGRRDRVPAARGRRTSSSRATSTCRTPGGSRTSSSSTPARSRRCASAGTRGPVTTSIEVDGHARRRLAQVTRSTARSGSSSSRSTRSSTRSTRARIEDEVTART